METHLSLSKEIDIENNIFINHVKDQLKDLKHFSTSALEWLMLEHYQFSAINPHFLAIATKTTQQFANKAVSAELLRNYNEEKNHSKLYRNALQKIGTDITKRKNFMATENFFYEIGRVITSDPCKTLGLMYATETAAIFEHEVFLEISQEVVLRRNLDWQSSKLKAFHDLHLSGVEQGHKDGLGNFVDTAHIPTDVKSDIDKEVVRYGASFAIAQMTHWWQALTHELARKSA